MLRIAIVGTGGMAHGHAGEFGNIRGCKVVAGVDVRKEALHTFCDQYKIPNRFTDVKQLLKNCEFDAAVVSTTDAYHVPCALPLVRAGIHVLCEKPIAPTATEGRKLVTAARKSGIVNMINFSYRNSPAIRHARKLISDGKLGRLMHLDAHYLQTWLSSPVWGEWSTSPQWLWRLSTAHGSGGVLGDVGVHIVDLVSFATDQRIKRIDGTLKTFDKAPGNKIGEYVLDANDSALMRIELEGGGIGTINATRWATGHQNAQVLNIYGDKGAIRLDLERSWDELEVCLGKDRLTAEWKTVKCRPTPNLHKRFIKAIRSGQEVDATFERGWEVQKVLDSCMKSDAEHKTISIRY